MRISEIYGLNKSQAELDFIDVDLNSDLSLFIDPQFLSNRNDRWSLEATRTVRSFFQNLVTLLASGNIEAAKEHFNNLGEPNETCLGLSRGNPQGRGVGPEDTIKIFENIKSSKAMQSGLVDDLEDCVIFVENFAKDKLSDMTTNIIRKHLIEYTKEQCILWGIPLTPSTPSGSFWDRSRTTWDNIYTEMLVINSKRYLLVPKSIVSYMKDYTPQKFHQHFALNFLKQEHLRLNTALVQRKQRKDGSIRIFVTKKSIKEQESPGDKEDLNNFVQKHPQVFKDFKQSMKKQSQSLTDGAFVEINHSEVAKHLQTQLREILPGNDQASKYHNLIVGILEFLFYPELTCPTKEYEINEGRKRIDILFDNGANSGLFWELSRDMPCSYVFVECKNYNKDPKNPELDQLSGRFAHNTGKVGLLVCRSIEDINTFNKRCSDTFKADRGLILPITDEDINRALQSIIDDDRQPLSEALRDRCRHIRLN
jgi:hypothetical protein